MKQVLHLLPRLPPAICGVGDFAMRISLQLRSAHQWESRFLLADATWEEPADASCVHGFLHEVIRSRNPDNASDQLLAAASGCEATLVEYSGYGFSKRGAPVWLPRVLRRLKKARPESPLVVMFHELYATGPITSSAFWLSFLMRRVAVSLTKIADRVHVNREAAAHWIEARVPQHRGLAKVMPVSSNFGEPPEVHPPSCRDPHLVFFGYQMDGSPKFWKTVIELLQRLKVERVTILNKPPALPSEWPAWVPVTTHGVLDSSIISAILSSARWGLVSYPASHLGKSGILAAMLAHGVVTVLLQSSGPLSDGLQAGRHLITPDLVTSEVNESTLNAIAQSGHEWYRAHDVAATAAGFAQSLGK